MHYKTNLVARFMFHECIKPFWPSVLILFSTGIYWAFDLNFRPYVFKFLVDKLPQVSRDSVFDELLPYMLLLFGSILLRGVVFRIYDLVWLRVKPAMKLNINNVLMTNIMQRSHVFLQKNVSGSLSNQIQDVINTMPLFLNLIVNNFCAHSAAFFISLFMFWQVNVKFAIVLCLWAFIFILFAILFATRAQALSSRAAKKQFVAFGEVVDVLHNIFRIKLFHTHKYETHRLDSFFTTFGKASIKKDYMYLLMYTFQTLSYAFYQLLCLLILIFEYKNGNITIGDFVLILAINRDMIEYMWQLSDDVAKIGDYYGTTKQVLNGTMTSYNADYYLDEDVEPLDVKKHDIVFENVYFKYPDQEKHVFENLSLKIKHKEKVGIVGYSGAGKSTLINILLRLCEVQGGTISINEQNIKTHSIESLRSLFSVIPQDSALLNRSIEDNIKYGNMHATHEEVVIAAKKAQAHEFIQNLAKGYDSLVGQKGSNLSIGQRQRIAIACAILQHNPIVIMDEATAALDSVTEQKLQSSIKGLLKNKTAIIIAHKLETLKALDRIIVLDHGRIVHEGTHKQLLVKSALYRKLIRASKMLSK